MSFTSIDESEKNALLYNIKATKSAVKEGPIFEDLMMVEYLIDNHWNHDVMSSILAEDEIDFDEGKLYAL